MVRMGSIILSYRTLTIFERVGVRGKNLSSLYVHFHSRHSKPLSGSYYTLSSSGLCSACPSTSGLNAAAWVHGCLTSFARESQMIDLVHFAVWLNSAYIFRQRHLPPGRC